MNKSKINAIAFANWCIMNQYYPTMYRDSLTGALYPVWNLHAVPEMSGAKDSRFGTFSTGELYEKYENYLNGK